MRHLIYLISRKTHKMNSLQELFYLKKQSVLKTPTTSKQTLTQLKRTKNHHHELCQGQNILIEKLLQFFFDSPGCFLLSVYGNLNPIMCLGKVKIACMNNGLRRADDRLVTAFQKQGLSPFGRN